MSYPGNMISIKDISIADILREILAKAALKVMISDD